MAFQYNIQWEYHPIIIGDKRYTMDPSELVPPVDTENFGKTLQEAIGKDIITDEMIIEHREKDTWAQMRAYRNKLLIECDWTQFPDVPDATKTAWQTYRQQLRDLPASASPKLDEFYELDLSSVTWPTKPS